MHHSMSRLDSINESFFWSFSLISGITTNNKYQWMDYQHFSDFDWSIPSNHYIHDQQYQSNQMVSNILIKPMNIVDYHRIMNPYRKLTKYTSFSQHVIGGFNSLTIVIRVIEFDQLIGSLHYSTFVRILNQISISI